MWDKFIASALCVLALCNVGCGSSTNFADVSVASSSGGSTGLNLSVGGSNTAGGSTSTNDASVQDAGNDASVPTCTPGEQRPCSPSWFGCPGATVYCSNGAWPAQCACNVCAPLLDAGSCSWTMEPGTQEVTIGNSSINTVIRIDPDAGQSKVPMAVDATACQTGAGYYAVTENAVAVGYIAGAFYTQSLTFTLCPASCAEHQQSPEVVFQLLRGFCPSE